MSLPLRIADYEDFKAAENDLRNNRIAVEQQELTKRMNIERQLEMEESNKAFEEWQRENRLVEPDLAFFGDRPEEKLMAEAMEEFEESQEETIS